MSSDLNESNGNLALRIERLEAIEEIKKLKAEYGRLCDSGYVGVVELFVEDGIWESPDFGKAEGHVEIRELFKKFDVMFSFAQHNFVNPSIEIGVDGLTATGTWGVIGPYDNKEDQSKIWLGGVYREDYVKISGEWKFQKIWTRLRFSEDRMG